MKRTVASVCMLTLLLTFGSNAFAQRDSGAKARGDREGFWSPRYANRGTVSRGRLAGRSRVSLAPRQGARRNLFARPIFPRRAWTGSRQAGVLASNSTNAARSNRVALLTRIGSNSPNVTGGWSNSPWLYQRTDPRRFNR